MTRTHADLVPPGPPGHLLLGHLLEFRDDPLGFFTQCARQYGDVVRYRIGPAKATLISHPDLVEQVLVQRASSFAKGRVVRASRAVLGEGLFTTEGDTWLYQRRMIQPAFHRHEIETYVEEMAAIARQEIGKWPQGVVIDLAQSMKDVTRRIATRILFRADVGSQSDDAGAVVTALWEGMSDRMATGLLIPAVLPTPGNLRLARSLRRLDDMIYRMIAARQAEKRNQGDVLSMLLSARDPAGKPLSIRQLRDELVTLFIAGHETTYLAVSWTWFLLAQHPDVEARLRAEVRRYLGDRTPTAADLPNLTFTEKVLRESLRLYPTAWAVPRLLLEDVELGGYCLPKGSSVTLSQWVVQRDPRFYEEPDAFRPDRWDGRFTNQLPTYAYFPFGGGPRKCIGHAFGMTEALLLTAMIAAHFHLALVTGHEVGLWPSFTLRPRNGIQVVLHRLTSLPDLKQTTARASPP